MNRQVWKFALDPGETARHLPVGSIVLRFAIQCNVFMLWVLHDIEYSSVELRRFKIVGTGQQVSDSCTYIGTAEDGEYVWHCFEEHQ